MWGDLRISESTDTESLNTGTPCTGMFLYQVLFCLWPASWNIKLILHTELVLRFHQLPVHCWHKTCVWCIFLSRKPYE